MMNQINRIVLNVLYRGLRVLYQKDSRVRAEMGSWAEGLSLKLVCGPGGAVLAVRKDEQHGVRRLPRAQPSQYAGAVPAQMHGICFPLREIFIRR